MNVKIIARRTVQVILVSYLIGLWMTFGLIDGVQIAWSHLVPFVISILYFGLLFTGFQTIWRRLRRRKGTAAAAAKTAKTTAIVVAQMIVVGWWFTSLLMTIYLHFKYNTDDDDKDASRILYNMLKKRRAQCDSDPTQCKLCIVDDKKTFWNKDTQQCTEP